MGVAQGWYGAGPLALKRSVRVYCKRQRTEPRKSRRDDPIIARQFYCWVQFAENESRRDGRSEALLLPSLRDLNVSRPDPALKRWAIIGRPCGTVSV